MHEHITHGSVLESKSVSIHDVCNIFGGFPCRFSGLKNQIGELEKMEVRDHWSTMEKGMSNCIEIMFLSSQLNPGSAVRG